MNDKLRILSIGGCGEIGKNMTVLEYGDEILVIDAGIMFPHNDMLGVDLVLPDYHYLRDKHRKIQGLLITHGHEDHIGAIPYLMRELPAPIYATPLTLGLIQNKLREGKIKDIPQHPIAAGETFQLGCFQIEPFHVTHSIPDCVGFAITTPVGLIVHTGDYKFDYTPVDGWPPDFAKLAEFSERGVLCLLSDSTNSTVPGWTPSEMRVSDALDRLFSEAKGRIIVASFATLISRIWQVADAAQKHGRKLALAGRSMRENIKIAQKLGYIDLADELLIESDTINKHPAEQLAIMATGSQGEPASVLARMARGRHPQLSVQQGDTIVISAHTIPGNEEAIYRIINSLMQKGAEVFYEENSDLHVSGHASQDEMKLMIQLLRPKFFIPVHGELRHLKQHALLAEQIGIARKNIAVVENGTPVELSAESMTILPRLKGGYIFVQGGIAGELSFNAIRQREKLATSGFITASIRLNRDGVLLSKPLIITEGFIDLSQKPALLEGAETIIRNAAQAHKMDWAQLNAHIEGALRRYLHSETRLAPNVYVLIHEN